jgi:DNA-binding NarL/FixJ family response regulator
VLNIFIISSHLMFSRGLESLLGQDAELKVIGQETDVEQALKQIKDLRPDVVIVYGDEGRNIPVSVIIEILKIRSGIKVISLNLQNNIFYVYQASQRITHDPEDLLKAIKTLIVPDVPRGWGNTSDRQIN